MNSGEELRRARKAQVEAEQRRLAAAQGAIEKHEARKALQRAQRFLAAVSDEK